MMMQWRRRPGVCGRLEPRLMERTSVEVKGTTNGIVKLVSNHTSTVVWRVLLRRLLIQNGDCFDGRIAYPSLLDGKNK